MGGSILEPHLFYAQLMLKLAMVFASLIVHAQLLPSAAVARKVATPYILYFMFLVLLLVFTHKS